MILGLVKAEFSVELEAIRRPLITSNAYVKNESVPDSTLFLHDSTTLSCEFSYLSHLM